ncbi:ribosomal subunit interface protein [bacterium (Candidatus Moisslbacteria) CG12_big_fil_rev_8_21_14_0_65_36_11]|nr:ribosome-associated translation inhibitor RaiA [Candidatus Kuenenbacteria bacterium]OIP77055.1 MAG: ribosomal subunit interface protein [Parcubacteria group bacterium CG2_30_36_38]PIV46165.1 MAG: ribosomal subunit interface protein [bacterium (Candidatus Moisslbacteria) CG02_land_8_20_14_3_00_36_53]PIW67839.1 MAG: ribosomal subunit interface protein [bacterium (Candidatus Moisslbacteria) CG12_big_fil_rev_8_21_14_0_65_36_11]PIZ90317.1 MAG: ribosomal subunit interface protein [bacterium (Candi
MEIKYFAKNFQLTPQIEDYIDKKINKFLRLSKRILRARVELDFDPQFRDNKNFKVEIKLEVPGKDLCAVCQAKDLPLALDGVEKKMRAQLTDYKEKFIQKRRIKKEI